MKRKHIFILSALMVFTWMGCSKDHFDINQNPNSAVESNITPDLTLAAQLSASASRNAGTYAFLNRWLGYWSASGSYSRSTVEMSYNITTTFGNGVWNGVYYTVNQYRSMGKKAMELDWKFYQGIAKIMEAQEVAIIVDMYGDVPYTEAWDLAKFIRPKYDKGEDVYKAIFKQVDDGIALIKAAGADPKIGTVDILFKGNKTNWYKFANSLKLRLLIHCSATSTFNAASEISKITAEGSGFLGNGLAASIQPGYNADRGNTFFRTHMFLQNGNEADNYNRANVFVLDLMKSLQDVRHTRFFREPKSLPGQYRGTVYGSLPADDLNSDRTSGPGYGLVANDAAPLWIMTGVEAMFLQTEAMIRGWLPGDAKAMYRAAVTESFKTLNVPNWSAEATTYLENSNVRVIWPDAGSQTEKIAVMGWQKYFALTGIQPNETWVDIRRLKVVEPPLSVAPERGTNPIPVRLLYPQAEYNFNSESVLAAGTISQFTSKVFWHK
jgi:hypothetical protein